MTSLQIIAGPCQRGQEFELAAEVHSIRLEEGRIAVVGGRGEGDVLLLRRERTYVFCGSEGADATLNREAPTQRRLFDGDELRVGPFRLRYETDVPAFPPSPRAAGFDWVRAFLCSMGMLLLLLAMMLFGGGPGGSGESGKGTGASDSGEGVGGRSGDGFGGGDGSGRGAGDQGSGTGAGQDAAGGQGGFAAAAAATSGGTPAVEAAETAPSSEPPTPGTEPSATAAAEIPTTETPAPPPPPAEKKMAILSPTGANVTPPPAVSPGSFIGERGGGGQILGTGDVQITLRWDTAPDVDLHVTDPAGESIWFQHNRSASGGILDVDDTEYEGPENIFWPTRGAPRGTYRVSVVLFEGRSANWWVRTRIDGVEKVHSGTLTHKGQVQRVIEFTR